MTSGLALAPWKAAQKVIRVLTKAGECTAKQLLCLTPRSPCSTTRDTQAPCGQSGAMEEPSPAPAPPAAPWHAPALFMRQIQKSSSSRRTELATRRMACITEGVGCQQTLLIPNHGHSYRRDPENFPVLLVQPQRSQHSSPWRQDLLRKNISSKFQAII